MSYGNDLEVSDLGTEDEGIDNCESDQVLYCHHYLVLRRTGADIDEFK